MNDQLESKIFVHEYENNKENKLVEKTYDEFVRMIHYFEREQVSCNPQTRLNYAQINDIQSIKDLFNKYTTFVCIHQDSERDIFIVS